MHGRATSARPGGVEWVWIRLQDARPNCLSPADSVDIRSTAWSPPSLQQQESNEQRNLQRIKQTSILYSLAVSKNMVTKRKNLTKKDEPVSGSPQKKQASESSPGSEESADPGAPPADIPDIEFGGKAVQEAKPGSDVLTAYSTLVGGKQLIVVVGTKRAKQERGVEGGQL